MRDKSPILDEIYNAVQGSGFRDTVDRLHNVMRPDWTPGEVLIYAPSQEVSKERERCAKIAETAEEWYRDPVIESSLEDEEMQGFTAACSAIAARIREGK